MLNRQTSFPYVCWIPRLVQVLVAPFVITSVTAAAGTGIKEQQAGPVSLSVTSAKANGGTRQVLSVSGFSPTSCSTNNIDSISIKLNPSDDETHIYTFKHSSDPSSFWFGMEAEEDPITGDTAPMHLGGSGSLYASTNEAVPGVCFISGRFFTSGAYQSLVVGTYPNGTVWGETIVGIGPPEADEGGFEIRGPIEPNQQGEDDGSVHDLLIVYTREAMCSYASLAFPCDNTAANRASVENQIYFLVAECNTILQTSGLTGDVPMSVKLAGLYMDENFLETGITFSQTLTRMITPNDGFFENPDLLALRESQCADLVILITLNNDPFAFGQVNCIGPDPACYAQVASLDPGAISGFTFTHELGHLWGCYHEDGPDFGRGFIVFQQYSTIMATREGCMCPGNRLPVFSDADRLFNGMDIGNANFDCVRRLETSRVDIAKFRDSATCVPTKSTCGIFRNLLGLC